MKILLIEDDIKITDMIRAKLEHEIDVSSDYNTTVNLIDNNHYDIIILDNTLIDFNAFDIISHINEKNLKYIMLTSNENNAMHLKALENKCIDYLIKPYDLEILNFKVNTILDSEALTMNNIVFGTHILNTNKLKIDNVKLTKNEFIIVKYLVMNYGKVVTKKVLVKILWDEDLYIEENTFSAMISRLRKKLLKLDIKLDSIKNKGIVLR